MMEGVREPEPEQKGGLAFMFIWKVLGALILLPVLAIFLLRATILR